ncbi:MAG: hypothetical protein D6832_02655, partial [Alphaproteobacteria bacterium]
MFTRMISRAAALSLMTALAAPAPAQTDASAFDPGAAVLDTGILFAIGARQAEQSLRGAFGWPTFQEGFVDGVYFRFDPDGYARFSPSPRLDADVFEVTCRPRTVICAARKPPLGLRINARGQVELSIDGLEADQKIYLNDGVDELPAPQRILQPLDPSLENLLFSMRELVIRSGESERARISLAGLRPTVVYLRWVAAHQDYSVLPRDWPIPGGAAPASGGLTEASAWPGAAPSPTGETGLARRPGWQPAPMPPRYAQAAAPAPTGYAGGPVPPPAPQPGAPAGRSPAWPAASASMVAATVAQPAAGAQTAPPSATKAASAPPSTADTAAVTG